MRPVNCRLWTHMSGLAPWTLGGWPISMIVVWLKPSRSTSPRTPPIEIRSPDIEGRSAQDDEIARDRSDHLLQGERQAGRDQAERGRQPRWIGEPDRHQPKDQERRRKQADCLAGPEPRPDRRVLGLAEDEADQRAEQGRRDEDAGDEGDRIADLSNTLGIDSDPMDTEQVQHALPHPAHIHRRRQPIYRVAFLSATSHPAVAALERERHRSRRDPFPLRPSALPA